MKVWITGFSAASGSRTFNFYLGGIINPSTANKYVSLGVKLYDGNLIKLEGRLERAFKTTTGSESITNTHKIVANKAFY